MCVCHFSVLSPFSVTSPPLQRVFLDYYFVWFDGRVPTIANELHIKSLLCSSVNARESAFCCRWRCAEYLLPLVFVFIVVFLAIKLLYWRV